ncbi:MAG: transporter substrate-binding domain-containing protein [Clostridia bacterium]|nr:transporter substrate-binding domain-containing protein [Clostridia bacterium]
MKKLMKILALVMVAAMALTLFAGCGEKPATTDETTTAANGETEAPAAKLTATDGVLVMATNASFPPYEFVGDDGAFAGIDVEIAGLIAEKLGLQLEIQDVEFGSIIGGVQSGKFDMGMAGMTVNEERLQSVNFSTTYATGVQSIIVKEDSEFNSFDDFFKEDGSVKDIMIGVQQDTTGDIYVSDTVENGGVGGDHVTQYKTGNDAVQALVSGKVDAVIIDNEPAKSYVSVNEGLKILETAYANEDYAICVAKNNTALLDAINAALAELTAEGKVDEIIGKYIAK